MQHWSHVLGVTVAMLLAGGSGQTGTVYRFRSGDGSGTVWVIGDNARLEPDPKDGVAASDRVSIWKAGGKQHLLLNTKDHTYYDEVTYLKGHTYASVHTLNVREPFIVADVGNIRVDLLSSSPQQISSSAGAADCRPVSMKLSYDLKLRLRMADVSIPGHVEGLAEYCLADSLPISTLPFRHGLELVSGIPKVDGVLAERLASLKGIPIRRTLTVTRQIEGGEQVSATSTLALSDFRATDIPADGFEVPAEYRYQEPVIIAPTREEH